MIDFILPRLALGGIDDVQMLASHIATLNLCEQTYERQCCVHIPIPDEVFLGPSVWEMLTREIGTSMANKQVLLVHCRLGVSRAPTLIVAYLTLCGWTPETALALLQEKRSCVRPHPETWRGLCEWWKAKGKAHLSTGC